MLISQLLSQTGGYIQNVALSALITEKTGSRMSLGLFLCVAYAPVFLLSYPAAKLSARVSVKRLLILSECLLFILSAGLLVFYNMPFWGYLAFGAVWGAARAFQAPAAAAAPRLLCEKDELNSSVALLSLVLALSRAAGPAAAGALYAAFDYRAAFACNALSYLPSVFFLSKIDFKAKREQREKRGRVKLSVPLLSLVFIVSLVGTAYNVVFTGVSEKLGLSRVWFSVFMAMVGAGAAVGAAAFAGRRRSKNQAYAALGLSLCALTLAFVKSAALVCAAAVAYGLCDYLFFTFALSVIQAENDRKAITRAMGIYTMVTTGALPAGFALLGFLSSRFSITTVLIAVFFVIAAGFALLYKKLPHKGDFSE